MADRDYDLKSADVYSFAMICYEVLTGKGPFADELRKFRTRASVISSIIFGDHLRPVLPENLSPTLAKLIGLLLQTPSTSHVAIAPSSQQLMAPQHFLQAPQELSGAVQRCRRKKRDGRHYSLLLRWQISMRWRILQWWMGTAAWRGGNGKQGTTHAAPQTSLEIYSTVPFCSACIDDALRASLTRVTNANAMKYYKTNAIQYFGNCPLRVKMTIS